MNLLKFGFCEDFETKFGLDFSCCDSCHEDFYEGYADLCEKEIDGIIYQICCNALQKYKDKFEPCERSFSNLNGD